MDLQFWANIAATISAMADVATLGATYARAYAFRLSQPKNMLRAKQLHLAYSTYSDDEIKAIQRRINNCRDRFVREGAGWERAACLCSVLSDVRDGNGGTIPDEDWEATYNQLNCAGQSP